MKAVIYVRQSRHKEGDRTVSPEVQEASCRALPAVLRCDQVEVFTDLDVSGGKRARRGYDAMLERIRGRSVAVVAAFDQSRAFRSTSIALDFMALLEEPQHSKVEVVFVHGSFDRSPVGGFSYAVLAAAHEMERRMTGEKIRAAYQHAARRGEMVGQVPGGYRREADGTIAVDEPAAATVRRVFTEYAGGRYSARDIARRLNAEGVPPLPRSRGAGWRFYSVAELLRNVAYTGQTFTESRRRHGKGQLMPATWPAIIQPELWQAAQRRAGRVVGRGGRRPKGQERPYVFLGLLRCSCGSRLSAAFRYGAPAYQCPRDHDARPCTESTVYERDLLPWGQELFNQLQLLTPADFAATVDQLARQRRSRHTSPGALQSIEASLERHQKLFTWGHVTESEHVREVARLKELREELKDSPAAPAIELRGLHEAWELGDGVTRRELLAALFDHVHISAGKIVGYTARSDRQAEVLSLMETVRRRVMKVGGDGLEPTTSSV